MVRRGVESVEAMPFVLDVRTLGERETHPAKNADRAIEHLGERVKRAYFVRRAGQRNIEIDQRARLPGRAQFPTGFLERGCNGGAHLVEQLADDRPLFFRERLHLFAPGRDAAAAPEIADARRIKRLFVRRARDLGERGGAQFFQRVVHGSVNR